MGGAAYRCANTTDVLYLPHVLGGLGLPVLASLYKQHQVSRQCILLMSSDLCVCHLALAEIEKNLREKAV